MSYRVAGYVDASAELERLKQQAEVLQRLEHDAFVRLGLPREGLALELGCGPGHFAAQLAALHPGLTVMGIDVDSVCLERARKLIAVARGDARELPIRDGSLDFAYARLALRHIARPHTALTAAHAALKPGGRLIVEDLDDAGFVVFPEPQRFRAVLDARHAAMLRSGADPFIGRKLLALMRGAGFENIQAVLIPVCSVEIGRERFADVVLSAFAAPFAAEIVPTEHLEELRSSIAAWREDPNAFGLTTLLVFAGVKPG